MAHYSIIYFETLAEAKKYRREQGCGGWLFVPEDLAEHVQLFPPSFRPSDVLTHETTRGMDGRLLA